MAAIVNQRDILLQATVPRKFDISTNFISINATSNSFSNTAYGVSPSSIQVTATLFGQLRGTVTWTTVPAVPFIFFGNSLTLPATSVAPDSSIQVVATLTLPDASVVSNYLVISSLSGTAASSLSSSSAVVTTNFDGSGGSYANVGSTMSVFIGSVDDSASWAYTWTVPPGVSVTGENTRTILVTGLTSDSASLLCTATRTNWPTQSKVFTVSKSKSGAAGSVVILTASKQLFVVAKNTGTVTPSSSVLTATAVNLPNPSYTWELDGVVQASTTNTLTVASFSTGSKLVKVIASSGGISVFDQLTLYAIQEGDDGITAGLENENQTISCDSSGTPILGQLPASSQFVVLQGSSQLLSGVTYSKVSETGMTSSINATTGAITVTAITADFASATYRASVGSLILDRTLNLNKSINGANGVPGLMFAEISVYKWTTDATAPTPPSGTGTYTWATGTYTAPAGWSTTITSNTVSGSTLWKSTVNLVATADVGSSMFTWGVTPVTYVAAVTTNFSSNISGLAAIPAGTQVGDTVFVFVGSDSGTALTLPADWTTLVYNTANTVGVRIAYKQMIGSVDASIAVSGLNVASVAVTRTYRGNIDFASIQNSIFNSTASASADAPSLAITTTQGLVIASVFIDDDNLTSATSPAGYSNLSWTSATPAGGFSILTADSTYSAAATQDPPAFSTNGFSDALTSVTLSVPVRPAVVAISSVGTNGTSAIFADLVSKTNVVATSAEGTGYTLPTGNSLRLYSGGTLVPSGVTYSGTTTKNGLTLTINSTTGAITLSGTTWTSNQETFTLTATYNSVAYTIDYTIAKSRAGSDAVIPDLVSESDQVFALTDGTGYTLPTGNSLRLYKGETILASGVTYSGTTTKNGLTLTINSTTGAITLSGANWTSNQETFTLTATYNGVAYTANYSISKSRTGATGIRGVANLNTSIAINDPGNSDQTTSSAIGLALQAALNDTYSAAADRAPRAGDVGVVFNSTSKAVRLSANKEVITATGSPPFFASTTIILSTVSFNLSGTLYHTFYKNGVALISNTTSTTYTVTTTSPSATSDIYSVGIREGSTTAELVAFDSVTIPALTIDTGVTIVNTNEVHDFPIADDGSIASYDSSGTTISVYSGTSKWSYSTAGGAGTYNVTAAVTSGQATLGTVTTVSGSRVYANVVNLASTTAIITFTITFVSLTGVSTVYKTTQELRRATKGNIWSRTYYFTGSFWSAIALYVDGNAVVAGTLSVNALKSGAAGVSTVNTFGNLVTGNFALGSGERTPIGNTAAIGTFTSSTNNAWALAGINTNTATGAYGNGILAATSSPGGAALGSYSIALQTASETNMKSAAVLSESSAGMYSFYFKDSSHSQRLKNTNLDANHRATACFASLRNYGLTAGAGGQLINAGPDQYDLPVYAELAYSSDNQAQMYAGLFLRRNLVATYQEAGRLIVMPSWDPTFAISIDGGGSYTATRARIPGGVSTFTGIHESQSDVTIPVGDIVIDSTIVFKQDVSNVFSKVTVSESVKDKRVLGVCANTQENIVVAQIPDNSLDSSSVNVTTSSPINLNKPIKDWELKYTVFVNAVGEGQVNVCGENGNIEAGDLIVTSSIPGKGMRQDDDLIRSYTVAKARESVVFDSPTQVKMIACTYLCG
jgi:hypothetical protein